MKLLPLIALGIALGAVAHAETETGELEHTFKDSHPMASVDAVSKRFRYREALPNDYDITRATFNVYVPPTYDGKKKFGLIVAYDRDGKPDHEMKQVLDEREIIWVSPPEADHELHTYGLAIDAVVNMVEAYKIDKKRIVLLGTGSGAPWAGRMGVVGGDVFDKIIIAGKPDYFRDLKIPGSRTAGISRMYYSADYEQPRGNTFNRAKKSSRFVFVAPDDLTEEDYHWCVLHQGFEQDFRNVTILERPSFEARRFDAKTFGQTLDALD